MTSIDISFFKKRNKVRNYLHFDKKINDSLIYAYVSDVKKIERHAFLPTLSYVLNEKKINRRYFKKDKIKKMIIKIKSG